MKIRIMAFVVLLVFTMSGCQSTSDEVYNEAEQGGSDEVDAIGEDNQRDEATDEVTNKATNENDKEQEGNDSDTGQEESNTDDYITMTMTGYNNGENTDDGMTVQIWYYDPIHDISENKFSFEASAQYSLGYYDKKNETVYYVKRVHRDTFYGDQIFMTDLKTGEETQLTEDLFAVNHIIPVEDRIIIVACKKDERPDELGYLDKASHEITFWRDEEDYCVRGISIDREKEQIYISAYLMDERDEIARKPVRENNEIPTYTVFQVNYDLTEDKALMSEKWNMRAVMSTEDKVIAVSEKDYNDPNDDTLFLAYDLQTNNTEVTTWTGEKLGPVNPDYSSDGQKIYGITRATGYNEFMEYDVETEETKILMHTPEDININNIFVVRGVE